MPLPVPAAAAGRVLRSGSSLSVESGHSEDAPLSQYVSPDKPNQSHIDKVKNKHYDRLKSPPTTESPKLVSIRKKVEPISQAKRSRSASTLLGASSSTSLLPMKTGKPSLPPKIQKSTSLTSSDASRKSAPKPSRRRSLPRLEKSKQPLLLSKTIQKKSNRKNTLLARGQEGVLTPKTVTHKRRSSRMSAGMTSSTSDSVSVAGGHQTQTQQMMKVPAIFHGHIYYPVPVSASTVTAQPTGMVHCPQLQMLMSAAVPTTSSSSSHPDQPQTTPFFTAHTAHFGLLTANTAGLHITPNNHTQTQHTNPKKRKRRPVEHQTGGDQQQSGKKKKKQDQGNMLLTPERAAKKHRRSARHSGEEHGHKDRKEKPLLIDPRLEQSPPTPGYRQDDDHPPQLTVEVHTRQKVPPLKINRAHISPPQISPPPPDPEHKAKADSTKNNSEQNKKRKRNSKKSVAMPMKWTSQYEPVGEAQAQMITLSSEDRKRCRRVVYRTIRDKHTGEEYRSRDCVLMQSEPGTLPYVAKLGLFYLDEQGTLMSTLTWYYRPEQTERRDVWTDFPHSPDQMLRRAHDRHLWQYALAESNELWASQHLDTQQVDCIISLAYVLTFEEYNRYRGENASELAYPRPYDSVLDKGEDNYKRRTKQPVDGTPEHQVFFARRVYDLQKKHLIRNPH